MLDFVVGSKIFFIPKMVGYVSGGQRVFWCNSKISKYLLLE